MEKKKSREKIENKELLEQPSTQMTANTAASTGNSGTVRIGKGSDESCIINVNITESSVSVINTTGEGRHTVNTQPKRPRKKGVFKADVSKTRMRVRHIKILTIFFTLLSGVVMVGVMRKNKRNLS